MKTIVFFVGLFSLLFVGGGVIYYISKQDTILPEHIRKMENIPANATQLSFQNLANEKLKLSSFYGKYVLVNFWATWCVPCIKELPALQALAEYFSGELIVLAISNEEIHEIQNFFKSTKNLSSYFIPAQASRSDMLQVFPVQAFPETYLLDRSHQLLKKVIGPQKWDSIEWKKNIKQLMGQSA